MSSIRFKPKGIEVPEADPFKEDLLGRKPSAEALTDFVSSQEEPFVLAINSPWGSGKTTFLRMWKQHLQNEGIKCVSYNAWENDFCESPLVSLIGELNDALNEMRVVEGIDPSAEKHLRKAKELGAAIIKQALPTAIKIATANLVDIEAIADLTEEVARMRNASFRA